MIRPASPIAIAALTAVLTAAALSGSLSVQHARRAWPFAADAAASAPMGAGREATTGTLERVAVALDPATMEQIGMHVEAVREEQLTTTVRAVATIVPDESRLSHVHTRVAGWVEQLDVNTTGAAVRAGQPLARIFSQELLSSQTEYLAARGYAASGMTSAVVASGRTRLRVLGMSEEEISAIERTGEPIRLVTVVAPRSGVVVNRGITEGTAVDPSTELLTIADLSRVWVLVEVPEADIASVRDGAIAHLEFPASGLGVFTSRVEFTYPMLTERTRTLRVRLSAANVRGMLKPGLYGTATFDLPGRRTLTVPRDAVVDTGTRQHVFVPAGGRFEPREVTIGARLADRVEILEGLTAGEPVVAAGVFLLDSESRLRAGGPPSQPSADPSAGHAGH
jgi:Cu(I)/Ag(I) efflux system membrane fusion protein